MPNNAKHVKQQHSEKKIWSHGTHHPESWGCANLCRRACVYTAHVWVCLIESTGSSSSAPQQNSPIIKLPEASVLCLVHKPRMPPCQTHTQKDIPVFSGLTLIAYFFTACLLQAYVLVFIQPILLSFVSPFECNLLYTYCHFWHSHPQCTVLSPSASCLVEKKNVKRGPHLFKAFTAKQHIKMKQQSFYWKPWGQEVGGGAEHFSTKDSASAVTH